MGTAYLFLAPPGAGHVMIAPMRARWLLPVSIVVLGCGGHQGNSDDDQAVDAAAAIDGRDVSGDADGDGISDVDEGRYDPEPPDTDGDGTPDWMDTDSDDDGVLDVDEGVTDDDGDGTPNSTDPHNDGDPHPITLVAISTTFNTPIGIDYHEPTDTVIMSVNYGTGGTPLNFEIVHADGSHEAFSAFNGLTDELKLATARSGNPSGIPAGTLYTGNGIDGQMVRISADGTTIDNPWVTLPAGTTHGLFRGSLYVDRTGLYGGDIIAVTTVGELWRINAAGTPTLIHALAPAVHLEGVMVVPNVPVRFGPLAGKIIAGAEEQGLLWAFDAGGNPVSYALGVNVEDIDIVSPRENFFGVNFGNSRLLGAAAEDLTSMRGDILLTQENVGAGTSGLFRIAWDGTTLSAQPVPLTTISEQPTPQWEHVTLAPAGIVEIPPID
jgi:hypothetical protein